MSESANPFDLDPALVRRSFDRASADYDRAAVLQAQIREQLLQRLELVRLRPEVVIDAGSGTGHASLALKRRYPQACVVALDLSTQMLRESKRRQRWFRRFERVGGDAGRMPFADGSVDLIFSNLMLQWCDPDAVFAEVRRVLKPHGLFTFTTFGPDTLVELRRAWSSVDAQVHVNQFLDMHDIGDALVRAGLAEPVLDVERYTLTYPDAMALMRDLKAIGAHNVAAGRPAGLTGRGRLARMGAAYEAYRRDGRLPATYEAVFGQAWGRPTSAARGREGETVIPIGSIRRGRPT
ncbi:MAG TPA: malonyl-ACP O-methyltransferase BioC [Steroidobacteraceae bacterium]|nr:malonyl-ACP O-methyltransferase BioC [Steroidobacteraceae bacterium]